MQQILGAHVVALYNPYVPFIYAAGAPTFTTPIVVNVLYEVDQYTEMEKDAQLKEDATINAQLHVYNTQPYYYPPRAPAYQNPPRPYVHVQALIHQNRPAYAPRPCLNLEARNACTYTLIVEPYAKLFKRLRTAGVLHLFERKLHDPIPQPNRALIWRGVIKRTLEPLNINNNPLPNHENWEVNMVTLDDEYDGPEYPNVDEADAMTSLAQPVIIVQLKEPMIVQTYLPRVVVTTLIAIKPEYDTKSVSWGYRAGAKGKIIDIGMAQNMTRSGSYQRVRWSYFSHFENHASCIAEASERNNGLGSKPTLGRVDHGSSKIIFIPKEALIPNQIGNDDIVEGIGNLFVAMAGEEEEINQRKFTIVHSY
ncbi:hypothetical protein H5410_050584 [Solanum commersonii]|uniref:Uncharacterized protein n=1 Tax=Solanum commersonii TaxID=4109 RepID=A0A9J5WXG7_SOLCO|nr:hypothetical protein H5410_050584 [Solanum commersonii]